MSLADKIRKAREQRVEVGGHVIVVRRPTDLDMLALAGKRDPRLLMPFVVGWDKVTEMDLFPGGDPHPAQFDPEAAAEWLADRPDLFGPVADAIMAGYNAHKSALESATKN